MHCKKGLTIIECLLSIIILAIMLTAGMAFYFNAHAGLRWSVHKRIAIEMASTELESIKNMNYSDIPTQGSLLLDLDGKWIARSGKVNGAVAIGNLTSGYKDVFPYFDPGVTLYKHVRVEIYWQDAVKSGQSSVSLDTYIAP